LYKEKARRYALDHLDWFKNAHAINSMIKNINVIHKDYKQGLFEQVTKYEENRIHSYFTLNIYVEKAKSIIRKTFVYPLIKFIWDLCFRR
jgi:hypothetical protein